MHKASEIISELRHTTPIKIKKKKKIPVKYLHDALKIEGQWLTHQISVSFIYVVLIRFYIR